MNDKFNGVETIIKDFLLADSDVMAIAKLVHEKLRDDILKYSKHETPAIAVHSTGFTGDADDRHNSGIGVFIEIVDTGGDLAVIDGRVKQLESIIIDKLRKESPYLGGKGMSAQLDDIVVSGGTIYPWNKTGGFLISGNIDVEVYIKE